MVNTVRTEYPHKLIHETAVRLGGIPAEDTVLSAWRVEYKRTPGGWRHFILLQEGAPTAAQVQNACALHAGWGGEP